MPTKSIFFSYFVVSIRNKSDADYALIVLYNQRLYCSRPILVNLFMKVIYIDEVLTMYNGEPPLLQCLPETKASRVFEIVKIYE